MSNRVRDIANPIDELLDLIEHAVDGLREGIELIATDPAGQPVTQVTLYDRQDGLPDTENTREDGAAYQHTTQHAGDRQHRDSSGETRPEMSRQGRKLLYITAHEQVVTTWKRGPHDDRPCRLAAQIQGNGVHAWLRRHSRGPLGHIAGHPLQRCIGQQQDALGRKLHANTGVDKGFQANRALTVKYFREPLSVGVEDFGAPVLHRHLPGVPERGSEQNERDDAEGYVAKCQGEGR